MTEIRADWPLTNLGEEFEIQQGKSLSPNSRRGQKPRPFLRTSNVLWGRVDLTTVDQMDFTDEEFSRLSLVDGDLLVCEGGDIGRAAVYRGPSGHYAYQNHLHRLRAKTDQIIPDFVVHWLRAAFTQLGLYEGVGNKTTIPNLSRARLAQLQIPKPDPDEQRQVASILGNVQRAIEVQAAICDKLAALKSATMAKLFREGLRGEPLKQTEIGEIPESWEVVRLGDRCKLKSGGTPSRAVPEYWGGDIPWVKTTEINYREIRDTDEKITQLGLENSSAKVFDKGTVLMAMYGQGVTRGRVALLGIPAATNQACAAFFPDETISPRFLHAYFTHAYERVRELGHGANQRNLSLELLEDVKIPVPKSIDEQEEISHIVADLQRRIELSETKVTVLNRLFCSALHALMTGAIRVKDLNLAEVSHV